MDTYELLEEEINDICYNKIPLRESTEITKDGKHQNWYFHQNTEI